MLMVLHKVLLIHYLLNYCVAGFSILQNHHLQLYEFNTWLLC